MQSLLSARPEFLRKSVCVKSSHPAGVTPTHQFLPEHDPVEEELQVFVCIINAELLEAVEGQILSPQTHTAGDSSRVIFRSDDYSGSDL